VRRAGGILVIVVVALAACAPAPPGRTEGTSSSPAVSSPGRTLTMAVRYEVTDLAPKIAGSSSPQVTKRLFNAALALIDGVGSPRPYLAEGLPQLNTDGWRLFPDGRMETTYRLRANLTWHDGAPLTAEDFAFAYRVYTAGQGAFIPVPQDQIEAVLAPDPRTVVIRWRTPYADAGALVDEELDALPQHILGSAFAAFEQDPGGRDTFLAQPYWTNEYVGAGPFRLERWEPGSQFLGAAFDGHALGRPKIDRVIIRIIGDENTVLTNVLSGNVDFTADFTMRFEHGTLLRREWEAAGKGKVFLNPSSAITFNIQLRPEYVGDAGLLDPRVRKALAHSIDRAALNEGVYEGQGIMAEHTVPPTVPYFGDVDRAALKYPFDSRITERLLSEAGYALRDGVFSSAAGDRLNLDVRVTAGPEFERSQAILVDTWRRAGVDAQGSILAAAQARDVMARQTFPGIASRGGGVTERSLTSGEIGTAANRWVGDNRGGWSSSEYDRLWESFNSSLDPGQKTGHFVQMIRVVTDQLPIFTMYFAIQVNTHVAALRGPDPGTSGVGTLTRGTLRYWNIHDWELS
jgi:peptide/nickel transport system substrate-binding protein